jgi:large subunit ribosomal protein L19
MEWVKLVHGTPGSTLPAFRTGDEVRVWYKILEQGKERLGQFEGTVIRVRGSGPARTFSVRRVTYGEGVERVFPADSKTIARVEVLRQGKVKRARLYYLRTAIGKTRIASAESQGTEGPASAAPGRSQPGDGPAAADKSEAVASGAAPPARLA